MLDIERTLAGIDEFVPGREKILSLYLDRDPASSSGRNQRAQLLDLTAVCREGVSDFEDGANLNVAVTAAEDILRRRMPRVSAVAVFVSPSRDPGIVVPLRSAVTPEACWAAGLHLTPLLAELDEHERMLVMLLDSRRARLFRTFMGEIEEFAVLESESARRNPRGANRASARAGGGSGTVSMGYDAAKAQRRDEEHVRQHMARAVAALERADDAELINRILLAGPVGIVPEFQRRLPVALQRRVSTGLRVPTTSSPAEVLEMVGRIEARIERAGEAELVDGPDGELQRRTHGRDECRGSRGRCSGADSGLRP